MATFSWIPFYKELSDRLLSYKDKRSEMILLILKAFDIAKIKVPKLDSTPVPADMDPFTVFGLFNKSISNDKRTAFCIALKEVFGIDSSVPNDFDGIPLLNPLSATYYRFVGDAGRGERDIDNLWNCFEAAIRYADDKTADSQASFIAAYDAAKGIKGTQWKLSMALFWIRPNTFLNLDSCIRQYLKDKCCLGDAFTAKVNALKSVPDGKTYVQICDECARLIQESTEYDSIASISNAAWQSKVDPTPDPDPRPTHYWLYAPGHNAEHWDRFYREGIMAIGWGESGRADDFQTQSDLRKALSESLGNSAKNPSLAIW